MTANPTRDDSAGTAGDGGSPDLDADPCGWGWRARARCGQADPELFFPVEDEPTAEAVRICGACQVRPECLEWALARAEPWGIWGGLSTAQRESVLLGRRIAALHRWRERNDWHAVTFERFGRCRRPQRTLNSPGVRADAGQGAPVAGVTGGRGPPSDDRRRQRDQPGP